MFKPPTITYYEMTVKDAKSALYRGREEPRILFDMMVSETSRQLTLVIAPHIRNGSYNGCVVIDMFQGDKEAVVQALKHDSKCAKNMTLEKKYGTRRMLLGAMHCAMHIAAKKMPHINKFVLQDEASYNCPPLSHGVKTMATDVLLIGEPYYARHLNMKPADGRVKEAIKDVRKVLAKNIEMSFSEFWSRIYGPGREGDYLSMTQSKEQKEWLHAHKSEIKTMYKKYANAGNSWQSFFNHVYSVYGCTFFASCAMRLVDMFRLNCAIGSAWVVRFKNLPGAADGADIDVEIQQMSGGGRSNELRIERALHEKLKKLRMMHCVR